MAAENGERMKQTAGIGIEDGGTIEEMDWHTSLRWSMLRAEGSSTSRSFNEQMH
jgi:hypothetical protein